MNTVWVLHKPRCYNLLCCLWFSSKSSAEAYAFSVLHLKQTQFNARELKNVEGILNHEYSDTQAAAIEAYWQGKQGDDYGSY